MSSEQRLVRCGLVSVLTLGVVGILSVPAQAQDDGPNTGNISFSTGVDVLPGSTYIFRGIFQEGESEL